MDWPANWEELPLLEHARLLDEASQRQLEVIHAREAEDRARHAESMARLNAIRQTPLDPTPLDEQNRQGQGQEAARARGEEAPPPEAPETLRVRLRAEAATTPADLQNMLGRDTYPSCIHASYAELAGRLARVEDFLEDLGVSTSLPNTEMEMIIGQ